MFTDFSFHSSNELKRDSEEFQGSRQKSLLKPQFQKSPSDSGEKKSNYRKSSVIETRHAKVIYQKRNLKKSAEGIAGGRINLLRALNKVKTDQIDGKPFEDGFDENSSSSMMMSKYIRSDEDCSDQSSYDSTSISAQEKDLQKMSRKRRSPASNASSDNASNWLKSLPPLPVEPPPKTDYSQEEFLSLFCLVTPKIAESLKIKRSKRKRRNCFKNEKNDFHYGNFDLNEVSERKKINELY